MISIWHRCRLTSPFFAHSSLGGVDEKSNSQYHFKLSLRNKIRTIFTKLRIDSNCIRDSRNRSYRGKKDKKNMCVPIAIVMIVMNDGIKSKTLFSFPRHFFIVFPPNS